MLRGASLAAFVALLCGCGVGDGLDSSWSIHEDMPGYDGGSPPEATDVGDGEHEVDVSSDVAPARDAAPPDAGRSYGPVRSIAMPKPTCAVYMDGTVRCSGPGPNGLLAKQYAEDESAEESSPIELEGVSDIVQLSGGRYHMCALRRDGKVMCWGNNHAYELTSDIRPGISGPTLIPSLSDVVQLSSGDAFSCALLADGVVKCWGAQGSGATGVDYTPLMMPTAVDGLPPVAYIDAGRFQTCAVSRDGRLFCWGSNFDGALGVGSERVLNTSQPMEVRTAGPVRQVSIGYKSPCAVLRSGDVQCGGNNADAEIGEGGDILDSNVPVSIDLHDAVQVSCSV